MAEFRWFGHNCLRIKAREATILTDPVDRLTGYAMPKQQVDIVTLSHEHPGHTNLAAVSPEHKVVRGPGEYEIHDVFITGIRTFHDAEKGAKLGYNTVYLIEVEGMTIAHLGDLGHPLTDEQSEAMSKCDVLMIPAGGGSGGDGQVISPEVAAEIIGQLEPKVVLPMQFATPIGDKGHGTIDAFCKALGVDVPPAEEKALVKLSDLTEAMKLIVLKPESPPAKR